MEYILTRTGLRPVTFDGELLAEANSRFMNGKEQNRWHELALYRTQAGTYLIHVGYRTIWRGELNHDLVEELPDPDELERFLALTDSCEHIVGLPGGDQFDKKRLFRQQQLERTFQQIVSELLAAVPKRIE